MKTKMTTLLAVLGALVLAANAQDNTPPPGGPPSGSPPSGQHRNGPGGPQGGFHLLPPRAAETLNLTDDQKKELAALEAETKTKVEKILTPEQLTQLKNMRPPMRPDGQGGQGGFNSSGRQGGPGGQNGFGGPSGQGGQGKGRGPGNGDGNRPPFGPPPGEGNGPSGPPTGDQ